MDAWPELDIYFPEEEESSLVEAMKTNAGGQWRWQSHSPVKKPVEDGQYFFHRDGDSLAPPCTLCLRRKEAGHLYVQNIVPDENRNVHEQRTEITRDFDKQITAPAAKAVGGVTSIGTDKHTLEDYFSSESIALIECFCTSSNVGDLGTHTLDQQRWMAFLLHVFRNEKERVSGDVFGRLLITKEWWPESGIRRLVNEYDFAMALLTQAEGSHD